MHKFKVGNKFVVVDSNSNSSELAVGKVHTIEELCTITAEQVVPHYFSDTGWFLEESFHVENRVLIIGTDRVFAVLDKVVEPDT